MIEIISTIIAIFATIPILTYFIFFAIFKSQTKLKIRSIQLAADYSSIFFIIAVSALFYIHFDNHFIPWIIVAYMATLIIVLYFQFKRNDEIIIKKAFRVVWRIGFIVMFILYFVLLLVGLIRSYL